MKDCITQCFESLDKDLTFEEAISCLDNVPMQLHGHVAMGKLKKGIFRALVNGFKRDDPAYDDGVLRKAGDALARVLGPGHKLLEQDRPVNVDDHFQYHYVSPDFNSPPLCLKRKAEVRSTLFF